MDVTMPEKDYFRGAKLVRWLKRTGERVETREPLFEISSKSVDCQIGSPCSGVVGEILVREGGIMGMGATVARIVADEQAKTDKRV
jgi:pyruvate/2-oxoglutarate dehydrogenase complex dihydrolipoamide acyltransferase (E2) component